MRIMDWNISRIGNYKSVDFTRRFSFNSSKCCFNSSYVFGTITELIVLNLFYIIILLKSKLVHKEKMPSI